MFDSLFTKGGLTFDRLRTLCMVAEAEGFTKAAGKKAQSQFSRQIRQLEDFFEIELVKRHAKGITVTPAGKQLCKTARRIFVALEDFQAECKSEPVRFSIGAGDSLLQWLLFPNIGSIQKALPKVGMDVASLPTVDIVERVIDLRLDFGLVRRNAIASSLKFHSLGIEKYALFVPRRLFGKRPTPSVTEVIAQVPLSSISGEGHFRATLQKEASKHKLPLRFSLCCSTFPQAARALRSERYAAILPTIAADELEENQFAKIPVPFLDRQSREICLIWNPRATDLRPGINPVKDCLVKFLRLPVR